MLYPVDGNTDAFTAYGRGPTGPTGDVSAVQLAAEIAALKGTATTAGDTLGELETLISAKANKVGPETYTGVHSFPNQSAGNDSQAAATTHFVQQKFTNDAQPLDALLTQISTLSTSMSGFILFTGGLASIVTFDTDVTMTANSDTRVPSQHAVRTFVESNIQGLNPKHSVRAATTANITLSGAQTIDGVAIVAGDRVLVKNQSTASQNGLYDAASGAWTRTFDTDVWSEIPNAFVFVEAGTTQADTGWVCTADSGGTLGSTAITWTQFSSAGVPVAGNGLTKTGVTFSIDTAITVDKTTAQALSNKDMTAGTNTWPTFNQNTTGSAATLTTARTIDGQSFDGSANITVIAPGTHAATSKATPVDADELPLVDSAASNVLKRLTWANLKATLNAVYDWATVTHAATGKTAPVDADEFSIVDSAAANVLKKLTWANLKATLYASPNFTTEIDFGGTKLYSETGGFQVLWDHNAAVVIQYDNANAYLQGNEVLFRSRGGTHYWSADGARRVKLPSGNQILFPDAVGTLPLREELIARNRVINPSGQISQAGVASTADGAYSGFDQWLALTQSNPITPSALTNVEDGTPFMMRFTQANASAQRYGAIQWMESRDVIDLRGKSVVLSARVRMSQSTTLRCAIVEWTGTPDSITKDIVNSWTNGTFTPGNFFNSTSIVVTATGSIALTANTLATLSLTGTVGSSMNNIAVFFWTDSTQAQNVTLDIAKVQLEIGSIATTHVPLPWVQEMKRCQRFWHHTYTYGTAPGTATDANAVFGIAYATNAFAPPLSWPEEMRVAPNITLYAAGTGNSGVWSAPGGTDIAASSMSGIGAKRGLVITSSGLTAGSGYYGHWVADARL